MKHSKNKKPTKKSVYDMGEIAGVKLTYVDGNVFATPSKRKKKKSKA